jgi:ParB family transcriptional regulator, chromosome partitioning protein
MTTTAAEKVAEHPAQKEKVEKRRALGRGLESLLPGPRVVRPAETKEMIEIQGVVDEAHAPSSAPDAGALTHPQSSSSTSSSAASSSSPSSSAASASSSLPQETIAIMAQAERRIPGNIVANIPIDAIDKNPYQTRLIFEEEALQDLSFSIKQSGVVQPVVVRPAEEEGRYILVLGERRLRASKMAGMDTIPAIVRRVSELQAAELTIVENMQRENLNCLEQAEAFRVLSKDFNLTQAEIAEKVGVSRESVSNYMRLLKLPSSVQDHLAQGSLGFSEAMVLLQMQNVEKLEWLAETAVEKAMNVEQIRDAVMRMDGYLGPKPGLDPDEKPKPKGGARWVDPNVRAAQMDLQRLLGMRVRIRDRKGKGKIVIEYATVDDYERVVGMLRKQ